MPTRQIRAFPEEQPCRHPDHHPSSMIVLPPGVYEHVCAGCKMKLTFTIPRGPSL